MSKGDVQTDAEVARKVMGLTVVDDEVSYRGVALDCAGIDGRDLPHFSTDLAEAMKVMDRMRELRHRWLLNMDEGGFHLRRVVCVHQDDIRGEKEYTCDLPLGWAKRLEDLPKVICDAALKEMEAELKESNRG